MTKYEKENIWKTIRAYQERQLDCTKNVGQLKFIEEKHGKKPPTVGSLILKCEENILNILSITIVRLKELYASNT